ncbi:MAG: hypothetical protein ACRDBI_05490 [Shewanella sp.]
MRLTLLVAASLLASAQASASLEQSLRQCAVIADASARLSCYDKLEASLQHRASTAEAHTQVQTQAPIESATQALGEAPSATLTQAQFQAHAQSQTQAQSQSHAQPQAQAQREDSFGMEAKRSQDESVDKIELEVSAISEDAYGALKVAFTNGQVWKQTEGRQYPLKPGERVFIQKAAFGSFLMGSAQRNAKVRVKRLK